MQTNKRQKHARDGANHQELKTQLAEPAPGCFWGGWFVVLAEHNGINGQAK
jgi:hypothetical protein